VYYALPSTSRVHAFLHFADKLGRWSARCETAGAE
jgi:hypothetical protein